jgi:hypothetical protein
MQTLVIILSVVVAYLFLVIVLAWAMRLKGVRERMTHLNKRMLNPVTRTLAVNRLGVLACLKHIGRRSGQEYVTPVLAVPFGDGFVVPLAYGTSVDWFRNVMTARACKLVWKKQEYPLEKPEVLTLSQTKRAYPWPIRWIFFAGGVRHHVFLHQQAGGRKSVPALEEMPSEANSTSA